MQGSLYLNSLPVQSDPFKLRGRTSYVHKRVWSCASLPGPPANLRTRPTLSAVRNAEQLCANQLQRRGSPTAHNEQRKHHWADGNAQEQSKMISKLMPTAAVLLSTAALICWSLPANADASVQAIEQVAQQLTSDSSGSLSWLGDTAFREGLASGFLLILFSELGDKTFFIALLLALKKNKGIVFAGTFGALAIMTVISVLLGQALHQVDELLPSSSLPFDDIAAAFLLVFFGIRTLQEANEADGSMDEEKEAQEEVQRLDSGAATGLLLSTFALVFAAEWGDKSFLATIALSAASSPVGVVAGAVTGHGVATLIAVLGGSVLGQYLNEKVVQYVGGSMFLVFAGITAFDVYKTISTG